MTVRVIVVNSAADYQQALNIRRDVFVSEQGVPADLEIDQYEKTSVHFLCFDGDLAVATGRLRRKDEYCKFERIVTLSRFRGKGYGAALMKAMVLHAKQYFPELTPYMHAQTSAVGFYEKIGWKRLGNEFSEAGIPHFAMTLNCATPL